MEKFEELINERTRAILICNPNNPTGYLYTRREMNQIRDLVKKYDLFLFSDEVYREFIYTGSPYISACHLEGIENNVVLIDSVSKRYSECGIRIGALITKNKEIRDAVMKFCQARLSPPLIGQLRLTAVSLDGTFDAASAEFVIGQPTDTINAKLRVVEHGGIKAAYSSTANRGVDAMLYGADGNLRGVKSYEAAQTEFSGLPAGRYTLVSIGSGSGLGTLQSLDILGRLGLADGEDYIADEINVTDGVIDKAEVGTVPLIDGKLPSYTTDETMLSANKSEIFAGQFVTLETNIKFREEFADAVGDVRLILSLPENFAYVDNSAIIGQALASCVDDGSTVTVDVPAEDATTNRFTRFCFTQNTETACCR